MTTYYQQISKETFIKLKGNVILKNNLLKMKIISTKIIIKQEMSVLDYLHKKSKHTNTSYKKLEESLIICLKS